MWFYVQHLLIGHQQAEAARLDIPRGNLSDLYPRWLGARELLLHHRDPYSAEVTREIQAGYYGRALDPSRPNDPRDQQAFAYPVYVVFLLAPAVRLPFSAVQMAFRWLLVLLTAASVRLWLRTLRWRPALSTEVILLLLTLCSFPVLQGIKLQQLTLLVSALLAGSVFLLIKDQFGAAGVLLALATIKPQLVLLLSAWCLLWAFSDWRRRQNLVWGFSGTMVALLAAAEYVLPGWMGQFWGAIAAYRQYNDGAGSTLDVLTTPGWGKILSALIVLALTVVAWRHRRASAESASFAWVTVLTLATTIMFVPKASPYNQVLLLPAVLLALQHWRALALGSRGIRVAAWTCSLLFLWPWAAALGLTLASTFLSRESVQQAWAAPLYTSLLIPIVVPLLLASSYRELTRPHPAG